jgi:hypothetical protein
VIEYNVVRIKQKYPSWSIRKIPHRAQESVSTVCKIQSELGKYGCWKTCLWNALHLPTQILTTGHWRRVGMDYGVPNDVALNRGPHGISNRLKNTRFQESAHLRSDNCSPHSEYQGTQCDWVQFPPSLHTYSCK